MVGALSTCSVCYCQYEKGKPPSLEDVMIRKFTDSQPLTIRNMIEPLTGKIFGHVRKDANDFGVPGIVFNVYRVSCSETVLIGTMTSGVEGYFEMMVSVDGAYKIVPVQQPGVWSIKPEVYWELNPKTNKE